ncbi:hypothetical protein L249_5338 [Ophiocordyceps polyrhachis-furcata BCC 54312]|uniref:Magnesium transporter NIPA n=1 Tax=Ophiocordyceps polyrhachis-furcata BCC 54312 TaxID=1330021 RepID=A0A367L942_9HYPO|nr:hypothetical protein L249_5338 [Ophiocordyceps polyrhachis-furcata BCC 54312]
MMDKELDAAPSMPEDPGKALRNWSSLIGIVTAIVGNMLIALALNVQRYAHTRLHKERVRIRRRAQAAIKRAQSNAGQSGAVVACSYGAVGGGNGRHDDGALTASYYSGQTMTTTTTTTTTTTDGVNDNDDDDDDDDDDYVARSRVASTYLKSPYWWLGQILITLGEMGNFLAYGFAPASIVSPLGVVALVSNCIIAPVMFHETFRVRDFWGVVIAVAGVVTVVLSAKQEETKLGPHEVWEAITTTAFEIYMAVTMALILVLMWASGRYGKRTILIDLGLVGLFGGYTALATKGVSSMLSSTLWRAFTTPVTYVLILILLVTAVMQIRYVNKALQRFDSTQVIPIQFVLFTLCVILGSAILYRDFEKTTGEQAAKFVGGCLLTFFGVFLITTGRQQQGDDDDDDDEDGDDDNDDDEGLLGAASIEETIGLMQSRPPPTQDVPPPLPRRASQSRRSSRLSRVSFANTLKPATPQTPADEAETPAAAQLSTSSGVAMGSAPEVLVVGEASTPLVSNPWRESEDEDDETEFAPALPPRGIRTLSADAALTAAASSSSSPHQGLLTPKPTRGSPLLHSHSEYPVTPRSHHHLGGSSRLSTQRRSKMFISPSPLSSTVTTVVKDAFLGGYSRSLGKKSSLKRLRSSIRASLFFADDDDDGGGGSGLRRRRNDDADADDAAEEEEGEEEGEEEEEDDDHDHDHEEGRGREGEEENAVHRERNSSRPSRRGGGGERRVRSRSVGDTLGDLFRPARKKKKQKQKQKKKASEEDGMPVTGTR